MLKQVVHTVPEDTLMSLAWVAAESHVWISEPDVTWGGSVGGGGWVDVCGSIYGSCDHQRSHMCLWSVLQPETTLMSVGPYCHQGPC